MPAWSGDPRDPTIRPGALPTLSTLDTLTHGEHPEHFLAESVAGNWVIAILNSPLTVSLIHLLNQNLSVTIYLASFVEELCRRIAVPTILLASLVANGRMREIALLTQAGQSLKRPCEYAWPFAQI